MTGITELPYRYKINGVLNTSDTVLANMEKITNSCATWISYDMFTGKWDVVINKPESVSMAFDDTNIIGSINLNGTGLRSTYNAVEVQFPHSDLNNQMDYIKIAIPAEDRLPNEPDNILTLKYDLLNDPIQAQYLGLVELKQARLDKAITFKSDYSMVNLAAGAVISITNSVYGWDEKLFRIVTIKEVSENGELACEISALEYDAAIYDTSDLYRYLRTNASGIVTIGSIGIPPQPQVTKFEKDARPRLLVEAEVPGGLVSGVEFWLTTDTSVGSDENRNYQLIGTVAAPKGGTLSQGDTVELDYDTLNGANVYVKVRGINGDITGPYSPISGLIYYQPVQTTSAIGNNTTVADAAGNTMNLLAANALLALLGGLFKGNTAVGNASVSSGSLWNTFWELFNTETGQTGNVKTTTDNIGGVAGGPTSLVSRLFVPSIVHTSKYNAITLTKGGVYTEYSLTSITLPYTGTYKVRYFANWGGAVTSTPTKISKDSEIIIPGKSLGAWSRTGDIEVPKFEDHQIEGFFSGTAGENITLKFGYATDDVSGDTGTTAVWLIAEVMLVPSSYA